MSVVVIGLQHTQAPLPLLEATAIADADLHKTLTALSHRRNVQEAVVLSTCLRTEIYAVVDRFHDAVAEIYDVLSDQSGVSVEELSLHAVIRFDDDVTSHLFSVASGLESVVTGETEVVGQVRRAFERAQEEGTCGPVLSALFRHALQTGKRVRTETGDQPGHDLVRLRRGDRGPGRGRRRAPRCTRRRGGRRRDGRRRLPGAVRPRGRGCAAARRRGQPVAEAGTRPRAGQLRCAPSRWAPPRSSMSPRSWPTGTSC